MVASGVCKRMLVPFILAAILMSVAVGGGAAYSGGSFWPAAKFGLLATLAATVIYVLIASASAIKNGFK